MVLVTVSLLVVLQPHFKRKQEARDRSLGCFKYRQMFQQANESYSINPNGKKWVRESMAADGLRNKHKCSNIGE